MDTFRVERLSKQERENYFRFLDAIETRGDVRTDMEPCWLSMRSSSSSGYGQISFQGKMWNLHRYSYYVYNGCVELPEKKHVCHKCDNKSCCNPNHLYLGTAKENAKDTWERGAKAKVKTVKVVKRNTEPCLNCVEHHKKCDGAELCSYCKENNLECKKKEYKLTPGAFEVGHGSGDTNVKAVLTREKAIEILKRHKAGLKYGELKKMATEYGIQYNTIQKLVAGDTWKEIDRNSV